MSTIRLSRGLVRLLAAIIAVTVANLYYAQPLLDALAGSFDVSEGIAGLVVTATQIGYAAGLVFVVPLGDITRRRRLLVGLLSLDAVALSASAAAPSLRIFAALAVLIGLASVVVQVIVPYAASLATDEQRPGVIGTLMGGLLIGMLSARAFSGMLAGVLGWRAVYLVAAGLMVAAALTLYRQLPNNPPDLSLGYTAQLRGVAQIARAQPVLRWRAAIGACGFAAFTCFWTTVTFLLADQYHMSELQIGLFALLGIAGAGTAIYGGRWLNNRPRHQRPAITAAVAAALAVSFVPLYLGAYAIGWLVVGVLVMDAAMQALNVTNQTVVYDLPVQARSRLTTVYITAMFAGGAAGSAVGSQIYGLFGWAGACTTAAGFALAGLLGAGASRRHEQVEPSEKMKEGAL